MPPRPTALKIGGVGISLQTVVKILTQLSRHLLSMQLSSIYETLLSSRRVAIFTNVAIRKKNLHTISANVFFCFILYATTFKTPAKLLF